MGEGLRWGEHATTDAHEQAARDFAEAIYTSHKSVDEGIISEADANAINEDVARDTPDEYFAYMQALHGAGLQDIAHTRPEES